METNRYREQIISRMIQQECKGVTSYGQLLIDNTNVSTNERVRFLEEELIDALYYIQWLKDGDNTFSTYEEKAMRTTNTINSERDNLIQGVIGLQGELGELCNLLEKTFYQGHNEGILKDVLLELGDILWYFTLICRSFGYSLESVATANIRKLEKRYCNSDKTVNFSAEKSVERKDT